MEAGALRLRIGHQNFHPGILAHLALKFRCVISKQRATAPDKTCALRTLRESDDPGEQVGSALFASHRLAALLY